MSSTRRGAEPTHLIVLLLAASIFLALGPRASATTLWWDVGCGGALNPGSGTWDAGISSNWSTANPPPSTNYCPGVWTQGADASVRANTFGAGTNVLVVSGQPVQVYNLIKDSGYPTVIITNATASDYLEIDKSINHSGGSTQGTLRIDCPILLYNVDNLNPHTVGIASGGSTITINGQISNPPGFTETLRIGNLGAQYPVILGGSNSAWTGGMQIYLGQQVILTTPYATGTGDILFAQGFKPFPTSATLTFNFASAGTITNTLDFAGDTNLWGNSLSNTNRQNQYLIESVGPGAATVGSGSYATMRWVNGPGVAQLSGQYGPMTLILGGTSTATNTFALAIVNAGSLTYSGIYSNTTVVKHGPGTWILTQGTGYSAGVPFAWWNNYSGGTAVNDGTLLINGNNSLCSNVVVVAPQGTLGGTGTIGGATTVNGTLAPGGVNHIGTLTLNSNLVVGTTATLSYALGTNSSSVVVNGDLTLGGTLNVADAGGFAAGDYTLFTYTGSLVDNGLTVGTTPTGSLTYSIVTGSGLVKLHVTATVTNPFDAWQTYYFPGGGASAAPDADADSDGMSNTNEFLAGFSPTSNAAYLHIISVVKTNSDISVTYLGANGDNTWSPGIASRTNVLEFTTGTAGSYAASGFASTGQTNILSGGTGIGIVTNMVDPGGANNTPARYYRVRVLVP